MTQALSRVTSASGRRWAVLKERHLWLRHVVAAWNLLQRNTGNQYAAAITYFSFLALFPLLLLAVSVTGFVLRSHPGAERDLYRHVTDNVPGSFGNTLNDSLQTAINARAGLGLVGLVGVLFAGLGWIGNLRAAIDGVWGRPPAQVNFFKARISNLLVLAGLGLGTLVSLGLTAVGTSLTDQLLRSLGFEHVTGAHALLKVIGILVAVLADMVIFWWLLIRLPVQEVPERVAFKGALLASAGFEVLKIVGTVTIAHTAHSPTFGPFAGIIAILVWIQLVARWLLYSCAWVATVTATHRIAPANQMPIVEPDAVADEATRTGLTPAAVGATLLGAGVLAGAVATWVATRERGD